MKKTFLKSENFEKYRKKTKQNRKKNFESVGKKPTGKKIGEKTGKNPFFPMGFVP